MSSRRIAHPVYESYTGRNTGRTPSCIRVVYQASIRLVYRDRDRDRDRDTPTGVCLWCLWLLISAAESLYGARFSAA